MGRTPQRPRRLALVESSVMGRSAVAVVTACVQVPAIAQLAGVEASSSLSMAGPVALPVLWALSLVIAGLLMLASYATRDQADKRVFEIGTCLLLVVGCLVYAVAVWDTAGPIGALWLLAIVGALAINATGRAVLLLGQLIFVRAMSRHVLDDHHLEHPDDLTEAGADQDGAV